MEIPWRSPLTWSVDQYILGEALGVDGEGCRSALDKFMGMRVLAIPIANSPDMSDGCGFFILRFFLLLSGFRPVVYSNEGFSRINNIQSDILQVLQVQV